MQNLRKILFTLFFLKTVVFSFSQDLVVTSDGDSIFCKINIIKNNVFHLEVTKEGSLIKKEIHANEVKSYVFDYFIIPPKIDVDFPIFDNDAIQESSERELHSDLIKQERFKSNFRISLDAGFARRLVSLSPQIPPDFHDFYNSMKNAIVLNGEISYFFRELNGIGVKGNSFISSGTIDVLVKNSDNSYEFGELSNKIVIHTISPFYTSRILTKRMNCFIIDFGIGYMKLIDNAEIRTSTFTNTFKAEGRTLGLFWSAGYDLFITNRLALGIKASFLSASVSKLRITENNQIRTIQLPFDERESLRRGEVLLGISVTL